jgi:SAM-dependent methyltransferase
MTRADLSRKYRSWRDSNHKCRKLVMWLMYQTRRRRIWDSLFMLDRPSRFAVIYKNNLWNNEESVSGAGSTIGNTVALRARLPALLMQYGVKSLVDAGCGDHGWMATLDVDVDYLGLDIVPELIAANAKAYGSPRRRFQVADLTVEPIPKADLVLCRDCLFHCSFEDAHKVLANVGRSGAKYLLATHCPTEPVNVDVETGWARGLNLELEPFRFPPPVLSIDEKWGRVMALWSMEDLPNRYRGAATVHHSS